jgi:DNA modification methylase
MGRGVGSLGGIDRARAVRIWQLAWLKLWFAVRKDGGAPLLFLSYSHCAPAEGYFMQMRRRKIVAAYLWDRNAPRRIAKTFAEEGQIFIER